MKSRYKAPRHVEALLAIPERLRSLQFWALRQAFREGYHLRDLRADALAGVVVGLVALPLSMALAIACGVPPQHGLYTAIVAGTLIALLGGSRVQVSGPTAAFVVILAPITAQYGLAGLALASGMAGVILIAMGLFRLGRLIEFIPYPVTTGFTAGIAVVIASIQLKDFFGLRLAQAPDHFHERLLDYWHARGTLSWPNLAIGGLTLALLILWPRITRRVPAALIALAAAAVAAYLLRHFEPAFESVDTVLSRFGGIPQRPLAFLAPWRLAEPGSPLAGGLSLAIVRDLVPSAMAIAILGAIESLLSAVVSDGMAGFKHDPDAELLGQGVGNLVAPFFGGFAATGAIARTAANVRAGARSPVASIVHAGFLLAAVMAFAPVLGYLPMASMAALLLVVAWNMSEAKHFVHMLRVAPRSDVAVLLTCFILTVALDMVIAVGVGVVLAALLFMRRMAELSGARLVGEHHPDLADPLPPNMLVYEVAGPLFFGAAQKAMSELRHLSGHVQVVLMDLSDVPAMDATGLVNLESAVDRLHRGGVIVILAGVQDQPAEVLRRAHWDQGDGHIAVIRSFEEGLHTARTMAHLLPEKSQA